jgi:YD repeat-containing protein
MEAHDPGMNVRGKFCRPIAVPMFGLIFIAATTLPIEMDRAREGLKGAVRQVTMTTGGTTTIRTYDRDGALIETVSRLSPGAGEPDAQEQVRKFVYDYDAKKQRLREMSQEQDGPPYLSRRYAYDAAGHQRAEAVYHMCGTFSSLQVFSYDGDGRLHEQVTYQFRSLGKRVYEYAGQQRLTTVRIYKNGVLQSTTQYRYDDEGRMSEQAELLSDATIGNKTVYEYDDRGRLVTERFTNRLDPLLDAQSRYEYDQQGNWTRKTTRRAGGSLESTTGHIEVTERVIDYY